MKFHGRNIDPISFWSKHVEFPVNMDLTGEFSGLTFCPNPDHTNMNSPAFQVNMQKPLVHCFSHCGISGSYEHAVCLVEGLYLKFKVDEAPTKQEKLRRRRRAHRQAKKLILLGSKTAAFQSRATEPVKKLTGTKALEYEHFLPPLGQEYLEARGINDASISLWELGWDVDEKRLVIPCHDEHGRLKLLIKRAVLPKQSPKYLYSEDSVKTALIFGAAKLSRSVNFVVLTEGSFDTIKLHQHGIPALGILGTGISEEQVKILASFRPKRVYLMFDKDAAGVRNIEIAMKRLRKYPLFICRYPKGKSDPAELTRREAERAVERAIPALLWRRRIALAK